MTHDADLPPKASPAQELNARIVRMRDGGAAWSEIERTFELTRQQARYAYQLGKRAERRAGRRAKG